MSEPLNVLVVDDDEVILQIFEDYLRRFGTYALSTARDGEEALKVLKGKKIDFCFTDLNMPGMDGIEFTKMIHERDNTIPVVVMTGYPSMENAITTLRHGVVDFLIKPFNIGEIELTIRRNLEQKVLLVENMLLKEEIKKKERIDRLNRELADKVSDLNILNTILQKVNWVKSSSDLFDLIVNLSADITKCDEVHFHVLEETAGSPFSIASFYKEQKSGLVTGVGIQTIEENLGRPSRNGVAARLAEQVSDGIPLLIEGDSDRWLLNDDIGSLVAIPFKIRKKLFGMLLAVAGKQSVPFTEKDVYYLNFLAERATFVIENMALYENIYENLFATLYAFVEAIEARDPYTKQHSSRVTELALAIGKEMGCTEEELDLLGFSGHLHDIGKLGIPDHILLKPGPLTEKEFEAIKKHPVIGANIVGHLGLLTAEQKIILHHHERWDGKGYPDGLKGDAIPFLSRILSVADVYDAMASDRAYRKRLADDVVFETIKQGAGTQFDRAVVGAFLKTRKEKKVQAASPYIFFKSSLESS